MLDNPQLWLCKVGDSKYTDDVPSWLSSSELLRYAKLTSINRRHQYLLSRALIRHAASQLYGKPFDFWKITEQDNAPPLIDNLVQKVKLSLSHSGEWIVLAFSLFDVGVDIETKKNRDFIEAASLFLSDGEMKAFCQSPTNKNFYRIWCLKEAVYKSLLHQQETLSLRDIDSQAIFTLENPHLFELSNKKYQLCLYSKVPITLLNCFVMSSSMECLNVDAASPFPVKWSQFDLPELSTSVVT